MEIEGVLFLAAGYGRRDEPLTYIRPKALLPFGGTSVLERLAVQVSSVCPRRIRINASRCPEALLNEISSVWPAEICELYFEERPLGASATLARHSDAMDTGTWMVVNTDMIIEDFDALGLVEHHCKTGSNWTALTGEFPPDGNYSPLLIDEDMKFGCGGVQRTHYWGVSLMEPSIPAAAARIQASGGMFRELASMVAADGSRLNACRGSGKWLDMGRIDTLRRNILSGGSFIHPTACISSDVLLSGVWNIGRGCILGSGTVLKNSVMLDGSSLESGTLEESILPWFCSSRDGELV
ncbi:MAG: NTP transferase domain-containing protein [Candidatus Aegiribacteria sp.]|nr:NTP transferase domain-containing protein [Candidatus Aegiribacteria sp.]